MKPPRTNGGKRRNAGRKPKPETVLKRMEQEFRIASAEESFRFVISVRNNPKVPWGIRLAAAQDIQDRVFGKAKQAVEHSGNLTLEQILAGSWDKEK